MASIIKLNPYKKASSEGVFTLDVVKFLKSEKGKKQILKAKSSSIYKNLTKK
jgi:hypothetical protein